MEVEALKSSTNGTQSERRRQRSKDRSPKQRGQQLPSGTQDVIKHDDGQGTLDGNRMSLKSTTSRHYAVSTENSDNGSSSDMEIYESVWHSQSNPTVGLSDKPTRQYVPNNSDSESSSSIEECKSTWKLQSQPTGRHRIKRRNTRRPMQSPSNIEMFETLWQPQNKTTTSLLKQTVRKTTILKQNTDSESSSSLNDVESTIWESHSKSISIYQTNLARNTSEERSNVNEFKQTWNPLTKPSTSHFENQKQIKDVRNYGDVNMYRATPRELTKLPVKQRIGFNHNRRVKITDPGRLDSYGTQNVVVPWGPSRQMKPNVKLVNDLQPSATSSATHIGQLRNKQTCSILKKSDLGVERNSFTSNGTPPGMPSKLSGRNVLADEVATCARRSPRRRPNTPVYNPKKRVARNGGDRRRRPGSQVVHLASEKRRQLLQHSSLVTPSVGDDLDNSVDNSERHSPLVRGKTRSRTRYYSTVGAVHSPPGPSDYAQRREWPADVGLVYAQYPRDFARPRSPLPPAEDREVRAHHVLHCAIAVAAFTTAASRQCEAELAHFLLAKMAALVCCEASPPRLESSQPPSKTTFLDVFGLGQANSVAGGEVLWLRAIGELIAHVDRAISQRGEGGTLVKLLNELLLATSLLYSAVSHTPHETVKQYIDSQTPELVTQWMKDVLTDNP